MNKWTIRIVIGVVIVALVGTGAFLFGPSIKKEDKAVKTQVQFTPLDTTSQKVVGEYSGGKITEGELNTYVNMFVFFQPQLAGLLTDKDKMLEFKHENLEELAAKRYVSSLTKVTDEDKKKMNEVIKEVESRFQNERKTKDSLETMVKGKGFKLEQLKDLILQSQMSQRVYASKIKGMTYDYVKLRHILVTPKPKTQTKAKDGKDSGKVDPKEREKADQDAKKLAIEIKQKLSKGADFAKLAKEYSDDPGSKEKGGVIEGSTEQFVPEFSEAAKKLAFGKISDPVQTSYGYHIMKVETRRKEKVENASEQVKQMKMQEAHELMVQKELKFKSLLPMPQLKKK